MIHTATAAFGPPTKHEQVRAIAAEKKVRRPSTSTKMTASIHRFEGEDVFENRGSAIPMSAVTFSPRYSISLRLPCDASRVQRGRNPALLRVHLHLDLHHEPAAGSSA